MDTHLLPVLLLLLAAAFVAGRPKGHSAEFPGLQRDDESSFRNDSEGIGEPVVLEDRNTTAVASTDKNSTSTLVPEVVEDDEANKTTGDTDNSTQPLMPEALENDEANMMTGDTDNSTQPVMPEEDVVNTTPTADTNTSMETLNPEALEDGTNMTTPTEDSNENLTMADGTDGDTNATNTNDTSTMIHAALEDGTSPIPVEDGMQPTATSYQESTVTPSGCPGSTLPPAAENSTDEVLPVEESQQTTLFRLESTTEEIETTTN